MVRYNLVLHHFCEEVEIKPIVNAGDFTKKISPNPFFSKKGSECLPPIYSLLNLSYLQHEIVIKQVLASRRSDAPVAIQTGMRSHTLFLGLKGQDN
jgi:hypothetical protein